MVLYVDYFTQGILKYKSYCVAGRESRNHVANKQIKLQGHLVRKKPHTALVHSALAWLEYPKNFVRRLYLWKVPGNEKEF